MGAACASPVEDVEKDVAESPAVGLDEEPLWRQVADAQIARRKEVQARLARPRGSRMAHVASSRHMII